VEAAAATPARTARAVHVIAKEDAPQSELRIGHVGLPRAHPDFFAVTVMNAVLGGLFSEPHQPEPARGARLHLRRALGVRLAAAAGPFVVDAAVKSDVTEAAAREVLKEIDRMRAEEISESELSLATSYLDGVFPIRYETTAAIASALASLVVYELPTTTSTGYRSARARGDRGRRAPRRRDAPAPRPLQLLAVGDPRRWRRRCAHWLRPRDRVRRRGAAPPGVSGA
jgi:zinc protease